MKLANGYGQALTEQLVLPSSLSSLGFARFLAI